MIEKKIDASCLYFGQQHIGTTHFFGEKYHTIHICDMPHYKFLLGDEDAYIDYLKHSWNYHMPNQNTEIQREKQVLLFRKLKIDIEENGCRIPITICKRSDGNYVIVDGNHRASISLYLGRQIIAKEISLEDHVRNLVANPNEFFGTKNAGKPYQSILINQKEIIKGRRDASDLQGRLNLIKIEDLQNKKILDVGCNYGTNCFYSTDCGASKALGIDVSGKLLTAAIRINSLFAKPCYFDKIDFAKLNEIDRFDTTFVFSVDKHINDNKMLAKNILSNTKKVVYFETHSHSEIPKEIQFIFSSIKFLGNTADGSRNLYRCII
jgi:2-polyprenyl-3-methyl-5-hydroxy-6-metoxy-1,4-benzoquinol methylase